MYIELPFHSLLQGGSVFFRQHFCEIEKNKNADEKCVMLFKKKISKKRVMLFKKKISKKRVTHGDSKKIYFFKNRQQLMRARARRSK